MNPKYRATCSLIIHIALAKYDMTGHNYLTYLWDSTLEPKIDVLVESPKPALTIIPAQALPE